GEELREVVGVAPVLTPADEEEAGGGVLAGRCVERCRVAQHAELNLRGPRRAQRARRGHGDGDHAEGARDPPHGRPAVHSINYDSRSGIVNAYFEWKYAW